MAKEIWWFDAKRGELMSSVGTKANSSQVPESEIESPIINPLAQSNSLEDSQEFPSGDQYLPVGVEDFSQ